jgi:hypothetical protein
MLRLLLISLLVFGANLLIAQQPSATSPKSETRRQAETLPNDPALPAAAIRDSYYHPDAMSGLDCTISMDWPAFLHRSKVESRSRSPEGDSKSKDSISQAARGKSPKITFEWTSGVLNNEEQFEDGLKQTLGGFYQMYWNILASSPISNAAEIAKIEPLPDGGAKVYSSSQNINLVISTDSN